MRSYKIFPVKESKKLGFIEINKCNLFINQEIGLLIFRDSQQNIVAVFPAANYFVVDVDHQTKNK